MKVTVCFGATRVVVPCGNGDLPISDLIEMAITRYKKASAKPLDYWVTVHTLKSQSDGGILDPDDLLTDVADDREQLIAEYEEQDAPLVPHNGGDGTSASSVGTASPDIFHAPPLNNQPHNLNNNNKPYSPSSYDVVITQNDLNNVSSRLTVRRGSEPALINIGLEKENESPRIALKNSGKRWSAISLVDNTRIPKQEDADDEDSDDDGMYPPQKRTGGNGQEKDKEVRSAFTRFARDSARQSLASTNSAMYRWLEAQERTEERAIEMQVSRKEPLGGSGKAEDESDEEYEQNKENNANLKDKGEIITLKNTGGALGIHVVPEYDDKEREIGLIVQGVETGGRISRDGRLKVKDQIIEINGTSLIGVDFQKAQDIFKQALQTEEIQMRVLKAEPQNKIDSSPDKKTSPAKNRPHDLDLSKIPGSPGLVSPQRSEGAQSPSKKAPPVPVRNPSTALSSGASSPTRSALIQPTNTRSIGEIITIELMKGKEGLGFSVTTRDNMPGLEIPVYIKTIQTRGPAIKDGRLKSWDRLLEVNGIQMTGKTQTEAVKVLREIPVGSPVILKVSRQTTISKPKFTIPRELGSKYQLTDQVTEAIRAVVISQAPFGDKPPGSSSSPPSSTTTVSLQPPDKAAEEETTLAPNATKEVHCFNIPLNDSGSAGLGVSVKGKTTANPEGTTDLGIFIKSVIAGGAAHRDERLRVNDQLVEVNNLLLVGKSNTEAMETLRNAMQEESPVPGHIKLVVARRKALPAPDEVQSPGSESREVRISSTDNVDGGDNAGSEVGSTNLHSTFKSVNIDANIAPKPLLDRITNVTTPTPRSNKPSNMQSPTIHANRAETVLIEGENYQVQMRQTEKHKPRPASTLGFLQKAPDGSTKMSRSSENLAQEIDWDAESNMSGDVDPQILFSREGFGRQSMSEKRKGHLDPKSTELYQKIKFSKSQGNQYQSATWERGRSASYKEQGTRLDPTAVFFPRRAGSVESLLSSNYSNLQQLHEHKKDEVVGPSLGLTKSSSLESLQTAIQIAEEEDSEVSSAFKSPSRSMVRGRGCNESFRAAVDRSYEGGNDADAMETLEEESSETGSFGRGPGGGSVRSSHSGSEPDDKRKKTGSKSKKDKGLFKFFKFGKQRKTMEESDAGPTGTSDVKASEGEMAKPKQEDIPKFSPKHEGTDSKIQEQFRELQAQVLEQQKLHDMQVAEIQRQNEKQRYLEAQMRARSPYGAPPPVPQEPPPSYQGSPPSHPQQGTQAERLQNLRAHHQRIHQERQGRYPQEDVEEHYERHLLQLERQRQMAAAQRVAASTVPPVGEFQLPPRRPPDRNNSGYHDELFLDEEFMLHGFVNRPQSRQGYVDPERYSHYQNLGEIQAQLQKHAHYQQMYQQQTGQQQPAPPRQIADPHNRVIAEQQRVLAEQQRAMAEQRRLLVEHQQRQLNDQPRNPPYAHPQQMRQGGYMIPQHHRPLHHPPHSGAYHTHSGSDPARHYGLPETRSAGLPHYYSQPDTRYLHPSLQPRSVTPGAPTSTRGRSPSPGTTRARSHTPINQVAYLSQHSAAIAAKSHSSALLPPTTNSGHQKRSYSTDYSEYDDPHSGYRDAGFNSLPRRPRDRVPSEIISGPAQV